MARHGVSRYNKVWTTLNTVGFNPKWQRDQVGRYCINCRILLSSQYLKRLQRKVGKTKFQQRTIIIGYRLNMAKFASPRSLSGTPIYIPNFKSIPEKTAEKSPENWILAKTHVKVDQARSVLCQDKLIYQFSSQYIKRRQRKIRKTEACQTDWQTISKLRVPRQAGRELLKRTVRLSNYDYLMYAHPIV